MIEIDVIAHFTKEGNIHPIRFRYSDKESQETIVVSVSDFQTMKPNTYDGNVIHMFRCESIINGRTKHYELKYEIKTCKWFLSMR